MKRLVTSLLAIVLAGCSASKHNENSMSQPSNDLETFTRFVQLPQKPVHVKFQTANLGTSGGFGPTDWALAAVIALSPADFETFSATCKQSPKTPSERPVLTKQFPWLDTELASGPLTACDATPFLRSPLNNGSVFLLSENRVLMLLSTS